MVCSKRRKSAFRICDEKNSLHGEAALNCAVRHGGEFFVFQPVLPERGRLAALEKGRCFRLILILVKMA